ncbi:MAG: glutathione S-transferase family protein [Acetobacteraceae bacterium]
MRRILWGRSTSSNVMKVVWLLEEMKLSYERVDVGGSFGKTDTAEYRAMNPTGLVPTLQEDDFTLWESNAILRYLGAGSAFFPQEAHARANIDRWMDAQQTTMNRPQGTLFLSLIRTSPEKRDPAVISAAIKESAAAWGLIGAELGKHPYICGDALSLADICWGVHVHRWLNMSFDRPEVANLKAWYDRLLARPAYKTHVAREIV